jgi:iron complex outermembrane receptor protein
LGTKLDGYAEAQYGNYTDIKVDGAVNLPVNEVFAVRLAFNNETRNSFYRDVNADLVPTISTEVNTDPGAIDSHNARLGLLYAPSDSFHAYLKTEYNYLFVPGIPSQPNQFTYTNSITGTVSHSPYYRFYTGDPWIINPVGVQSDTSLYVPTSLELNYILPNQITLKSLTGYQYSSRTVVGATNNTSDNTGYQAIDGQPDQTWSQEIDVLSPTSWRLNFVGGAIWMYRDTPARNFSYSYIPPYSVATPQTTLSDFITVVRGEGLFGQVNYQWTDTLQFTLGLRENWDNEFNGGLGTIVTNPSPPQPVATVHQVLSAGQEVDSTPTGKVGLNWTPLPGQFFYAFAARGYKSGGVATNGLTFQPETINDYELGWKGKLLDGHLLTQVGGFYMDYFKQQEQIFSTSGTGTYIGNLQGTTTIHGIEVSEQSRFGHFGTDFSLGYTQSKLGSFTEVASYELPAADQAGIPQCTGAGGTAPPPAPCFNFTPYLTTLSGESEPLSPELSVSADIDYAIPVGGDGNTLTPKVTYSYQAKQYASLIQIAYNEIPEHSIWGATLTYKAGPWLSQLYVDNLSNETYINGNSGNNVYYGNPRQFGIRVNRTFR